jgi:hypothetical protein
MMTMMVVVTAMAKGGVQFMCVAGEWCSIIFFPYPSFQP